jgi:hypothetical protein
MAYPILWYFRQRKMLWMCMVCTPRVREEPQRHTEIIEDEVPKEAFDRWLQEQVACEAHRQDTGHPRLYTRTTFFGELGIAVPTPIDRREAV